MKKLDKKYKQLLSDILKSGVPSEDRTGVGTLAIFGSMMKIDLSVNKLPAISCRRVAPRIAFEELMFMLNGKTQTKELEEKGINIWKGNTSREFLDSAELHKLEEGDFGQMYGVQLRKFNGIDNRKLTETEIYYDETTKQSIDQLKYMVNEIKTNPSSRRIIATHYNPAEVHLGVLFPCHIMTQFNVNKGKLDCLFWMRSSDVGFGLPYNLMYYGFFLHIMAKLCDLEVGNLVYQCGDTHIYNNQIESGMIGYILNDEDPGYSQPNVTINKEFETLDEMLELKWENIEISNYNPRPDFKNKPKMAV